MTSVLGPLTLLSVSIYFEDILHDPCVMTLVTASRACAMRSEYATDEYFPNPLLDLNSVLMEGSALNVQRSMFNLAKYIVTCIFVILMIFLRTLHCAPTATS